MFKITPPEHGVLDARKEVAGHVLTLRARQIRLASSGLTTALVAFIVDTTPIHSTWLEIDKDDKRAEFAKSLFGTGRTGRYKDGKLGDDIVKVYPQSSFEQDMMLWSRALWPAFIGATAGGYEEGDAEPTTPRWAVPGLVLDGQTSIWFGDAKAGKSSLMRLTAQALNTGASDVIPVRGQEPFIWVNAEEDPREHTRQLGNVNQALGIDRTSRLYTIHARGMHAEDLAQRLEKAVREVGAAHIGIDSLSRLARGLNLNENATATLLMDSIGGLGPSANWIGHTGQENAHRLSGSKHFTNAARLMVRVQGRMSIGGYSPELKRGVRASVSDVNGAAPTEPMYWTFEYHRDYGLMRARLTDSFEWPVLNCEAMVGETKQRECGRVTWDGVMRSGAIRCSRHRGEDDEE